MIQINSQDLYTAMFMLREQDGKSMLHRETGEIRMLYEEFDDAEEMEAEVEANPEQYLEIPELDSRESFEFMEEFIEKLAPPTVAEVLRNALTQRKPFRKFRDAISDFPEELDAWYKFEEECQLNWAYQWLKTHGIEAELKF